MPEKIDLTKDMELIAEKLCAVKKAGYGEVLIRIQNGNIVYITHSIGEQITIK